MRERTKRRYKRYWNNLKDVKLHILLRFLSLLVLSVLFSTAATILNLKGVLLNSRQTLMSGLGMMFLMFFIVDFALMRKDYYILTHKRKYRMVSYISHGAFAFVNVLMCRFFSSTYLYAFTFSITKFLRYTHFDVSPTLSALIFNAVLIIAIQFAPIGMKWLHLHHG